MQLGTDRLVVLDGLNRLQKALKYIFEAVFDKWEKVGKFNVSDGDN